MSCQFFRVSVETENSRMGIFVWLVVCQGLVNGTSEHGYKCETVTRTRPDFCCRGVVCCDFWRSLKVLLSCCLVDTVLTKAGPVSRWDQFALGCAVMASLLS